MKNATHERRSKTSATVDLGGALLRAFRTNERVNQRLLSFLSPRVWRASPPNSPRRNIATSFAHLHHVRCMRLKMSGDAVRVPARLDRARVEVDDAATALRASAAAMEALILSALAAGGRVRNCRSDVVSLVMAAITHEAHHRGQICQWARELGEPVTPAQQLVLWDWDRLWKETEAGPG